MNLSPQFLPVLQTQLNVVYLLPGCYAGEELGRHSRSQAQTHKHSLAIPNRTPSASASEVDSAETP